MYRVFRKITNSSKYYHLHLYFKLIWFDFRIKKQQRPTKNVATKTCQNNLAKKDVGQGQDKKQSATRQTKMANEVERHAYKVANLPASKVSESKVKSTTPNVSVHVIATK